MKKRIPSLNEFITATNTLGLDGHTTNMADTIKNNKKMSNFDAGYIKDFEKKASIEMIASKLGIAFRDKAFPFATDWDTYILLDIEKPEDTEKFSKFLMDLKIQFDKLEGFKIYLTEDNIKKIKKI